MDSASITHFHKHNLLLFSANLYLDVIFILLSPYSHFPFSPFIFLYSCLLNTQRTDTHRKRGRERQTQLHPLLHQWLSQSLPLTSQQAVFHLPQIAPVCHPKLCLQSCLPTPLQHMAHLIGLKTLFWIRKRGSCIIIWNIQIKCRALIGISGGVEKDRVTFMLDLPGILSF